MKMNGLSVLNVKHIALQGLITVGRSNYKIMFYFFDKIHQLNLNPFSSAFIALLIFKVY